MNHDQRELQGMPAQKEWYACPPHKRNAGVSANHKVQHVFG